MKRLKSLQPIHRAAVRYRVAGWPNSRIQEELGVEKHTLHKWFSDDLVLDELRAQLENVDVAFAERLAGGAMAALDEMLQLARMPVANIVDGEAQTFLTPEFKLKILMELMDRNPATRRAMGEGDGGGGTTNVLALVQGMTDDDLRHRALELTRGGNGHHPPDIDKS